MASARKSLSRQGIVILTGPPGVGKSWIAAQLGWHYADAWQRIWINCNHDAADLGEVIWHIAHHLQNEALWEFLEADRVNAYPNVTRVGQMIGYLSQGKYVLCFDGFYHIKGQREIASLIDRLADRAVGATTDLKLIITARYPPLFLSRFGYQSLKGLDLAATQALLARHKVGLDDAYIEAVHRCLGGIPEYVNTVGSAMATGEISLENEYRGEGDDIQDSAIARTLLAYTSVQDMLVKSFRTLPLPEKKVLFAVAMSDDPVTVDVLKAALVGEPIENVWDTWHHLRSQGLLLSVSKEKVDLIPLVRAFYREMIPVDTLHHLHHNLAEYFSWKGEVIKSVKHHLEAKEVDDAATLLCKYAKYAGEKGREQLRTLIDETHLLDWPVVGFLEDEMVAALQDVRDALQ